MDKCKLCNLELNSTGKIVTNHLNDKYHDGCLTCSICCQELSKLGPYFCDDKTGTNYCAKCNIIKNDLGKENRDKLGHCNTCFKFLNENDDTVTIEHEKYHQSCFKCIRCRQVISSENVKQGYYNREQSTSKSSNYCCNACVNNGLVDKCQFCNVVILTSSQSVNGKGFHLKCFKCFACDKVIKPDTIFSLNKQTNSAICQDCS